MERPGRCGAVTAGGVMSISRHATGGLAILQVALLASCALGAGEPIYSFQQDLESRLKGTEDENHRYAVLVPLRVITMDTASKARYGRAVLDEIDRLNIREALPLLERDLAWTSETRRMTGYPFWEGENADRAARLWIRFSTEGMNDDERAKFLAGTFRPGYPVRVQDEAGKHLEELGPKGRRALLRFASDLAAAGFTSEDDVLIAGSLGSCFERSERLRLTEEEVAELARSPSPFVRLVCVSWYAMHSRREAVDLAMSLMDLQGPFKYRVWSAMLQNLAFCPGKEHVFTAVLKAALDGPPTTAKEYLAAMAVCDIRSTQYDGGPFAVIPPDLAAEIRRIAEQETAIADPEQIGAIDELKLFLYRLQNRERAETILTAAGQ